MNKGSKHPPASRYPLFDLRRSLLVPLLVASLFIVVLLWCWWWPVRTTTIYLARHAEKASGPPGNPSDPPLSPAGEARAQDLAHMLGDEGIEAIFVTNFQRTQQTAAPLAAATGITPIIYDAGSPAQAVDAILADHQGQRILVIGHSNTLDDLAAELGAAGVPELGEQSFDRLFVIHRFGATPHLDRLRYGEETP